MESDERDAVVRLEDEEDDGRDDGDVSQSGGDVVSEARGGRRGTAGRGAGGIGSCRSSDIRPPRYGLDTWVIAERRTQHNRERQGIKPFLLGDRVGEWNWKKGAVFPKSRHMFHTKRSCQHAETAKSLRFARFGRDDNLYELFERYSSKCSLERRT